ncbi:hypothetical protein [Salinibacterium sp. ZJ454]|uniref:hypothetical protein n=1 Tax=Salinibacterium sp. ZJ454 TaxID=2708339 RepID=UPI00141FDFEC|nr:hypothetical protein [Salinibacterium sp. ZJ454]
MADEAKSYELTVTLSINSDSGDVLDEYVAQLESALVGVIREYPAITAYFVSPDYDVVEIQLGLRFESMPPKYIEDVADEVLDLTIDRAAEALASGAPVREESTLVPA